MDEEITIINEKTRKEKIKKFFLDNKRSIILSITFLAILVLSFYSYQIYNDNSRKNLSEKYNLAIIDYNNGDKLSVTESMKDIVNDKDSTYSPLALYFLIDNNLIENKNEINDLFDVLITKTSLASEIKNLVIYKKALFNANTINENDLLNILKPLINSNSVWKSHATYLIAEYFFSKNEKQKSKEFFLKILDIENANQDIVKEAQKRLNRDLSE